MRVGGRALSLIIRPVWSHRLAEAGPLCTIFDVRADEQRARIAVPERAAARLTGTVMTALPRR
jgi:hypothetical protein